MQYANASQNTLARTFCVILRTVGGGGSSFWSIDHRAYMLRYLQFIKYAFQALLFIIVDCLTYRSRFLLFAYVL